MTFPALRTYSMNRIICAAVLSVLGGSHPTAAQVVRMGTKGGVSLTTLVGPGTGVPPSISPLVGAIGGLYRTFALGASSRWVVQAELLYSQQGYRLSNSSTGYKATLRSNYVCLPVLLTGHYHGFFGEVGPQLGYLAGVREEYFVPVPGVVGTGKRVNTDPKGLPRWDGAAVAGLGYQWPSGWSLELRYTGSFTGIYERGRGTNARPRHAGVQALVSVPLLR
ncbi:porin family protein [Hymenobacter glacialis]|uniref:Outer membrane protein beta-barrel domain-containing protein n=1 Tax=Hymenobacter glacialis TaxID=1908236 RepID=A0A1G1TAD7_9BACT|nr:porin family protein [Hymenobacter glacialis]OGX87835.1 hypothetical protein BEN48_10950 [Hymenobacter glacialis]